MGNEREKERREIAREKSWYEGKAMV